MTFAEFRASLAAPEPPPGLDVPLRALWLDGKGDWNAAHASVDDAATPAGARVHAYLHRKEGDLDNARYWYRRASAAPATGTLDEEWAALVSELLGA